MISIRSIANADICVADVTGRNPNVSYELGMAHALRKPVLIIAQDAKDIPFDYKHLRALIYDTRAYGWEASLGEGIAQTIREVTKNPEAHLALKSVQNAEDQMLAHLRNIFYDVECDIEKIDDMFCDSNCNALVKTRWNVVARTPVYHLCHNLVSERSGLIEIRRVYDKLSGRSLEHLVIDKGERHLSYLILLKQFKKPNHSFVLETEVFVEGYLDGLTASGEVTMAHQAAAKSGIRYIKKIERYHFPKDGDFGGVYAEYLSHPRNELVGTVVSSKETVESLLLQIEYDAPEPYKSETGAVLHVPRQCS